MSNLGLQKLVIILSFLVSLSITDGKCYASVHLLLKDCIPFISGVTSTPGETCCSGVGGIIWNAEEVECLCQALNNFAVILNAALFTSCHYSVSLSLISMCYVSMPPSSPPVPAVSPPPPTTPVSPPPPAPTPYPGNDTMVNPTNVTIDDGAVCLFGNPATYYYIQGFDEGINNWIVYLPEGGWCMNVSDCEIWMKNRGGITNPAPKSFGNIFSKQKEENPGFFNWNKVYIRFCDASSFTGDFEIKVNDTTTLYFRGARILKAVMLELLLKGMGNAQNALLAGSSAGGVATAIYCDRFRRLLPFASRVKCLSDAGYFFLAKNHSQGNTFLSKFEALIKLHRSRDALPTSCITRLSPELCFFPPNLQARIQTPIFFLMSAFDRVQIEYTFMTKDFESCNIGKNCSFNQIKAMQDLRTEFLTVLPKQNYNSQKGILITSPYIHTRMIYATWNDIAASTNKTYDELFKDWYFDREDVWVIDRYSCPYNCSSNELGI